MLREGETFRRRRETFEGAGRPSLQNGSPSLGRFPEPVCLVVLAARSGFWYTKQPRPGEPKAASNEKAVRGAPPPAAARSSDGRGFKASHVFGHDQHRVCAPRGARLPAARGVRGARAREVNG